MNLDLIYGTPGESDDDLRRSVEAAIDAGVDHVSAYSLIVEDGTPLARRVRRGELPAPDDDVAAARYGIVDRLLTERGHVLVRGLQLGTSGRGVPAQPRRTGTTTTGGGSARGRTATAAASAGGTSSIRAPTPSALAAGQSPTEDREVLTPDQRQHGARDARAATAPRGSPSTTSTRRPRQRAAIEAQDGLLDAAALTSGRLVLTDAGRLLADAVIRRLVA